MKRSIVWILAWAWVATATHCTSRNDRAATIQAIRTVGDSVSLLAQRTLLSRLTAQIETNGFAGAVQYCSVQALPLLDSVKGAGKFTLQRISEKYRNPADQPEASDLPVLQYYAQTLSKTDTVVNGKKYYTYYKPIYVAMNTCLNCHGTPLALDTAVKRMLHDLYPNDKATGYVLNDFRGAWKLQFPKKEFE